METNKVRLNLPLSVTLAVLLIELQTRSDVTSSKQRNEALMESYEATGRGSFGFVSF